MLHIPALWYYSPQMYWWRDYPFQLLQRFLLRWNIIIHFRALKHTFIWRRNGHSHTLLEMETLLSLNHLSLKYHSQAFKISPQCLSQIIDPDTNFLLKGNLFLSLLFNLLVLKPEYSRRTRPISWLLMHWQLTNRVARSPATTTVDTAWHDSHGDCVMIPVFSFSWWRHQMPRYWPFVRGIHRWPVNSPHKGQWRGALMLSLICARIDGWVNNLKAGDLRRHCAQYSVTVMERFSRRLRDNPSYSFFTVILYRNGTEFMFRQWFVTMGPYQIGLT